MALGEGPVPHHGRTIEHHQDSASQPRASSEWCARSVALPHCSSLLCLVAESFSLCPVRNGYLFSFPATESQPQLQYNQKVAPDSYQQYFFHLSITTTTTTTSIITISNITVTITSPLSSPPSQYHHRGHHHRHHNQRCQHHLPFLDCSLGTRHWLWTRYRHSALRHTLTF